ncbi:MAG TPA: thioesterase family protein [Solirubrobacteraceae bacterium]|nr:thioesterase family protein [Solirubrobacteraceae bacterium]
MTTLDEMLDSAAGGAATIADGWGQGRATYGGLVAGLLVARAEALVGDGGRRLRSASFAFIGPVAPGAASLDGTVLRAGSSATQIQVTLIQDGEPRAALLASFGVDRDSAIAVDPTERNPAPDLPGPAAIEPIPYVPGAMPEFFAHFDLRYVGAAPLRSGAAAPDFGGWMRFAVPPERFGDRELVTLADAWPPAISPMLERRVPMSSLAWTFEPIAWAGPEKPDATDAHWQYDVRTFAAGDGYAHTRARIWDAQGRLRALSSQTVAYFA